MCEVKQYLETEKSTFIKLLTECETQVNNNEYVNSIKFRKTKFTEKLNWQYKI